MSLAVRFRHSFPALDLDIQFEAPTPGVIVLFGPSGCGKSLTVAAVVGLFRPAECRIAIEDTVLVDTEARVDITVEYRRIGTVFQDSRLFPHMTVLSNLRYGMRRAPAGRIGLDDVVDLLGIRPLLDRRPARLSGGERQRVAIGRALLSQPRMLVMDEPLASLDAARKAEILPFLGRLKSALALPMLYVTHSYEEMASLGDTLVLMRRGQVRASGPLDELTSRGDLPIATRDDAGVVLTARIADHDRKSHLTKLDCNGNELLVPLLNPSPGSELRVRIPARDVILAAGVPGETSVHNMLAGHVRTITHDPVHHEALVEMERPGLRLLARVTLDAVARLDMHVGKPVIALVKSVSIEILPR
jgi:molybdate transport system ATP-binding protein